MNRCEKPALDNDSICSDVVDYAVPTPIAKLATIIESSISSSRDGVDNGECRDNYRRSLCQHRFPRCQPSAGSSSLEVILNEQTYTTMLAATEKCASYADRFSRQERIFTLDDSCRPISELTVGFNFMRCSVEQKNLVTPWMFEYLKSVDLTLSHEPEFLYVILPCGEQLAFHLCNFIGRCTNDGHVEFINNYEFCTKTINCYSYDHQEFAEQAALCYQWPQTSERMVSPKATTITNNPNSDIKQLDTGSPGQNLAFNSSLGQFAALSTVLLGLAMFHILAVVVFL